MSKVEKMSIKEILSEIEPMLCKDNIGYIFYDREVAIKFLEKYENIIEDSVAIEPILIEYEKYIDKEKLVLLLLFNYKENILKIGNELQKLKQGNTNLPENRRMVEVLKLQNELDKQSEVCRNIINISKGIKSFLTAYYYDEEEKRYKVILIGVKEIISAQKSTDIKAVKKFDKIDRRFRNEGTNEEIGLEFVLQSLMLTDLYDICENVEFGDALRTMILDNNTLKTGKRTHKELEELKRQDNKQEYDDVVEDIDYREILTDVKNTLREYADHIDMDKLLIISAFRFFDSLEKNSIGKDMHSNIELILKQILSSITDKKIAIDTQLQIKKDGTYELQDVKYAVKDLEATLARFVDGNYVSLKQVDEYRRKVNELEISILDLPVGYTDVIFSKDELNQIALLSEENLIYVAGKLKWENKTILEAIKQIGTCSAETILILIESEKVTIEELTELYEIGIIKLETIQVLKDRINFSNIVDFESINNVYLQLQKNPKNKELLNKYKRYIELYKEIYIKEISEEEQEENSNVAMAAIIENFDDSDYDKAIKEYYTQGLITLDSIADWSNEDLIINLYNEQIISQQDLEELAQKGKIPESYVVETYESAIWDNNLSQNQRVEMLSKGWISIGTIEKLFRKNLIDREDLRILVEGNVISEENRIEIVESLSLEEAEANSSISLAIDDNMKKIHGKERVDGNIKYPYPSTTAKSKIIISPNAREEFFELLGAKKVKTTKIEEDNPFYNYQFYIIPGQDGKIHLNSPVIAERYYEDKETERTYATENATYFFQYGDLMVLSNYAKKDEVVGKKENVVFRSNHTIANPNRKGHWGASVIGNVVRTLLSSDLKEYNSENQKLIILAKLKEIYNPKQIAKILSFEEDIDLGKHLYEVVKEKSVYNFNATYGSIR